MKKILTSVAAVLCAVIAAWAGPEITWLTYRHNFGAFDEDRGPVSCDFRFVNTGDAPLTVISARASCGCTTPLIPSGAVEPGDTASISVAYNPAGRPGRFNKSVSVETDAVNMPKTKLTVTGVVIGAPSSVAGQFPVDMGDLKFNKPVIVFGQVDRPALKTVFTGAYNLSPDSVRPRVVSKPRYIDIDFEPKTVGPGEQITLISYFRSGEAPVWGFLEDSVIITTGRDRFAMPFTATVAENFSKLSDADRADAPVASLSETSVDFGRITARSPLTRTVTLTNRGKSPLEIRRLYTADPGVTAAIDRQSLKPGKTATITVTVDPSALTGDILTAAVTLITNAPSAPTQPLRVVGEIVK